MVPQTNNFSYVTQVREESVYTKQLQSIVSTKAKYGRSLGLAKKVLDLAQKLDCFNEVNGMFQNFLDDKQTELLGLQISNKENLQIGNENNVNIGMMTENPVNCSNPMTSRRRERPPKRYLSEGRLQSEASK